MSNLVNIKTMNMNCPLCESTGLRVLVRIKTRTFWRCQECGLTFLSLENHLNPEDELSRYLLHENHPDDPAYRNFLGRLAGHLVPKLHSRASGLDYGSGPGPTLSIMMEEQGFPMEIYDPYFSPNPQVLLQTYDFITCTETVEHFYNPGKEFEKLSPLLKPGGWLGIMTELLQSDDQFSGWHYHREPTHVCFYKKETMDWISKKYNWIAEYPGKNVVLFQKGV